MAGSTAIGALLLGLSLILLLPVGHAQEGPRLGGCPNSYITTFDFDAKKISEMIGSTGYQTIMMQGTNAEENQSCQKLQVFDGTAFSYSFMDADGEQHQVSGRYRAVPTSFRTHGFLELFGLPNGVLGANLFGIAHLYPLVSRSDAHVYLSCSQRGIFYTENVYTFVPNNPASLRGAEEIRELLSLMGVPNSKTLVRTDQTCVKPVPPANGTTSGDRSTPDVPAGAPSALDSPSSEGAASNVSTSATSASNTTSNGTSNAASRVTTDTVASSSNATASNASLSDALTSDVSPSDALSSNVSSGNTSAPEAPSSGPAASDASSSDVLPSGASSNDALASVASSIEALASEALSSDSSSLAALPASESNAVEDGPQDASSGADEEEPAIEGSVDKGEAS